MIALRVAMLGLILWGASCATSRTLTLVPTTRAFTAEDYDAIYRAWTRSVDDFSFRTLQDVLHVTATFEAWEFRWAYVVRYCEDYGVEPSRRDALLRSSLGDAEREHRFFVTIAGRNWRESDLLNERSVWRAVLLDDTGRQLAPARIERVLRPGGRDRAFFPSISSFRQTFRISFPVMHEDGTPILTPRTRVVTLRFTGPPGQVDLVWDLLEGPPTPAVAVPEPVTEASAEVSSADPAPSVTAR